MNSFISFLKVISATLLFDFWKVFIQKAVNQDGFLIFEDFLTKEKSENIYRKISASVDDGTAIDNVKIIVRDSDGVDAGMLDIVGVEKLIVDIEEILKVSEIEKAIKDNFSIDCRVKNYHCYINKGVINTRDYHADSHAKCQYKAFIYLTDVTKLGDGPYCFIKGSHQFSLKRYSNIIQNFLNGCPLTDYAVGHSEAEVVKFLNKKGTLIITDQNGAHRGWPQAVNGNRCLVAINFEKH